MFQYSITLTWSDEDGGYIATVPELPNLSAFAEIPEKAVKELQKAANLYMEVLREDGKEIPSPRKLENFSGQIRLRMPRSLHRKLAIEARSEGVSLNTLLLSLLSEKYGYQKASKEGFKLIRISLPSTDIRDAELTNLSVGYPPEVQAIADSDEKDWSIPPERATA